MTHRLDLWSCLRAFLCRSSSSVGETGCSIQKGIHSRNSSPLLILVEGTHDIAFLKRISAMLSLGNPQQPDLGTLERQGHVIFIPFGGGTLLSWTHRLAGLGLREFYLFDKEISPETELREQAARLVNLRPRCRAVVTSKRSLENYLHPDAIRETRGIEVTFTDDDSVPEIVARHRYSRGESQLPWEELPSRARKRLREKAKRWLNREAVEQMTLERLDESDPDGDICGWLMTIAELLDRA